jgi:hypothetical protein
MGAVALTAAKRLLVDGAPPLSLECHDCCTTHVSKRGNGNVSECDSECDSEEDSSDNSESSSKEDMQSVIHVDSRARVSGTDSTFDIELRESLHLDDHGVRVDRLTLTNSF